MAREQMDSAELEQLKNEVECAAVLESSGFALDVDESTRNARKYRRGTEIVIVIHRGRGWFDPLSDGKGDVFDLAERLGAATFVEAVARVASLIERTFSGRVWQSAARKSRSALPVIERWNFRSKPRPGSPTWLYLAGVRRLPAQVIQAAIAAGIPREGPYGSMWAAHLDAGGAVCGWEERGAEWRGFATGGTKTLFALGSPHAQRLCVTEAAIDAMSLAALEGLRADTLYLSTGGGWSTMAGDGLAAIATRAGTHLVAATDNNDQGDVYAGRLLEMAHRIGCPAERLTPRLDDWNAQLQLEAGEIGKRENGSQSGGSAAAGAQSPSIAIPARRPSQG